VAVLTHGFLTQHPVNRRVFLFLNRDPETQQGSSLNLLDALHRSPLSVYNFVPLSYLPNVLLHSINFVGAKK
jgi:hypothetical protein